MYSRYPTGAPTTETMLWTSERELAAMASALAGDRADCCGVAAAFRVLLSATCHDRSGELLLCAHHYRAHRTALARAGAVVYDADGLRIAG